MHSDEAVSCKEEHSWSRLFRACRAGHDAMWNSLRREQSADWSRLAADL